MSPRAWLPFLARLLLAGALLLLGARAVEAQGRRVALVVGIGNYQLVDRLRNPGNDAASACTGRPRSRSERTPRRATPSRRRVARRSSTTTCR